MARLNKNNAATGIAWSVSLMYYPAPGPLAQQGEQLTCNPYNADSRHHALLAQMDRALPSGGKGHWFDSSTVHHAVIV